MAGDAASAGPVAAGHTCCTAVGRRRGKLEHVVGDGADGAGDRVAATRPGMRHAIVRAARTLLEERGVEEALTLRAVARGAGITAPSVYNHFPDLAAVLEAVVEEAFGEYEAATDRATAGVDDPLERIRAGAHAYIRFAHDQPATYRLLFARHRPSALPTVGVRAAARHRILVDAIEECASRNLRPPGADAAADALTFWAALHGLADLPPAHPRFPWPDEQELVERLLRRVVLRDPGGEGGRDATRGSAVAPPSAGRSS